MISGSAGETERLGADLAARLVHGDIVAVAGELGAGKTTFVRGACRALGVVVPVTSPTFTIGQRYPGAGVTVAHLDLYRLSGLELEEPDLLADYIGPRLITFVEWPEVAGTDFGRLGAVKVRVTLSHGGGDRRQVTFG